MFGEIFRPSVMKISFRSSMGVSEGISDWTFVYQGMGNRGINVGGEVSVIGTVSNCGGR